MLHLPQPYLLFLGDVTVFNLAKTAFGLRDWAREKCIGEFGCGATITTGLPFLSPAQAFAQGARSLVIGVANPGGTIPRSWCASLTEALAANLDIVSGMHTRLADIPELRAAAERFGRELIEVRRPPASVPIATGRKRVGKRLLTVGTDCALGKKYTALALASAFKRQGLSADFRATGQTGIMIAGEGLPMDAVVSDFVAGAAEIISPDAACNHWDVIEGQGSIFHPSYAAVSVDLLHGSQPDVIVVCHEPGRSVMAGISDYGLPSIEETIELNLAIARRTNPAVRCAGVSLNTSPFSAHEAERIMAEQATKLDLPVADPIRAGERLQRLVEACLREA